MLNGYVSLSGVHRRYFCYQCLVSLARLPDCCPIHLLLLSILRPSEPISLLLHCSPPVSMKSTYLHQFAGAAIWASCVNAITLFAADSGGNVTTLFFEGSDRNYTLGVVSKTTGCEVNPSWLTLDSTNRVLYCYDRGSSSSTSGSLNSFSIEEDGVLSRISRVSAPLSGVAGEIVTSRNGIRGYVSAS